MGELQPRNINQLQLSRRSFLRLGLTGGAAALAAACGQRPAENQILAGSDKERIESNDPERTKYVLLPLLEHSVRLFDLDKLDKQTEDSGDNPRIKSRTVHADGATEDWTIHTANPALSSDLVVTVTHPNKINSDEGVLVDAWDHTVGPPQVSIVKAPKYAPKKVTLFTSLNRAALSETETDDKLAYDSMRKYIEDSPHFLNPNNQKLSAAEDHDGSIRMQGSGQFDYVEPIRSSDLMPAGIFGLFGLTYLMWSHRKTGGLTLTLDSDGKFLQTFEYTTKDSAPDLKPRALATMIPTTVPTAPVATVAPAIATPREIINTKCDDETISDEKRAQVKQFISTLLRDAKDLDQPICNYDYKEPSNAYLPSIEVQVGENQFKRIEYDDSQGFVAKHRGLLGATLAEFRVRNLESKTKLVVQTLGVDFFEGGQFFDANTTQADELAKKLNPRLILPGDTNWRLRLVQAPGGKTERTLTGHSPSTQTSMSFRTNNLGFFVRYYP